MAERLEPRDKHILVVEDDDAVRTMLVRVLGEDGYPTLPAANGTEALQIARTVHLDLVVIDLGLPDKAGWDVFEKLTRDNPLLAVIVITAKSNQSAVAKASGVGAFLEKPLDFSALLDTAGRLLAEPPESRLNRMLGRAPNPPRSAAGFDR
jgi:CheY-like chemotaxis protein